MKQVKKINKRDSTAIKDSLIAYFFIAPAMLWIFGIFSYSVLYNLVTSLFLVGLGGVGRFVGFESYIRLFRSSEFWTIVGNTGIWLIVITISQQFIALTSALLLSQNIRGRAIYRTILLLPWVIPGVVAGILWRYMFDARFGVINDILMRLGLIDNIVPWLAQPSTSLFAVIVAYVWKVFPFSMILLLGSIQGIPEDVYEAAEIEGAGSFQKFFYVTIPMIKTSLIATTIFTIITAFNSYDLAFIMTGGGPVNSSMILGLYVYNLGFTRFDFGGAAAAGTLMFLTSLFLIFVYVLSQNRKEE